MTMTVNEGSSSSVPTEDEDDELLTPREKNPKPDRDQDNVFIDYKKVTHHPDFSPKKEVPERTYSTNSSNGSDVKQDNLPNIFNVSCTPSTSTLSSIHCLVNTNTGQSSYPQMDPFDCNTLTKQYHSASNLLQNISKTAYFESGSGKYTENNNNTVTNCSSSPSGGKYFENKYFPGSQSDFSSLISRSVSSTNYSFGPSNMLASGFGPPPQSIISKSYPQISGSGYLPTTSSYSTLGSNTGSSYNAPCFNPKFGSTENNNYLYAPNLFSSKLPTYSSTSQGSTQIFPPPFGNNGFFHPGISSPIIGSDVQETTSNGPSYNQGMVGNNSGGSSHQTPTTASPFSPTIPLMGSSTHSNQLHSSSPSPNFENRMNFHNESSYTNYLEMEHNTPPANYNTSEKSRSGRKTKSQNGVKKPAKSKKTSQSDPEHTYDRIFIWDLDETVIVFRSLISGEFAAKFQKDPTVASTIGFRLEEMIYHIASSQLFFSDLEDCDQVHVDDISTDDNAQDLNSSSSILQFPAATNAAGSRRSVDWNRKLAVRYRRIKELYTNYRSNDINNLLGTGKREQWMPLRMEMENFCDSWLTLAIKCLSAINRRSTCLNVLVSSSQLIPTLAECMLFGLTSYFPIENIYSANKDGNKEPCFQRVQSRFGRKCTYVVIGNGRSEMPSKQLGIPFWRISTHGDLVNLHHALELGHLFSASINPFIVSFA